jgi:hypothetical protein
MASSFGEIFSLRAIFSRLMRNELRLSSIYSLGVMHCTSSERKPVVVNIFRLLAEHCFCLSGRFSACLFEALHAALRSFRAAVAEFHIIGNNLCDEAFGAVLRIIGASLKRSFNCDLAALGQITRAELCGLSPADDVEKIRFALAGLLISKAAGNRQAQRALGNAGLGGTGFGIGSEIADQDYTIDNDSSFLLYRSLACIEKCLCLFISSGFSMRLSFLIWFLW